MFFINNPPEDYKEKILEIRRKMEEKLANLLGLGSIYEKEDFDEKYKKRLERLSNIDCVYKRTLKEIKNAKQSQKMVSKMIH